MLIVILLCYVIIFINQYAWYGLTFKPELYYSTIRSLDCHVVYNVPFSCKANGDRNQFGAWLDSDVIVE